MRKLDRLFEAKEPVSSQWVCVLLRSGQRIVGDFWYNGCEQDDADEYDGYLTIGNGDGNGEWMLHEDEIVAVAPWLNGDNGYGLHEVSE